MDVTIRTIGRDEWQVWRQLRLRGLVETPDAFRSTHEEESSKPDSWWMERIGDSTGQTWGNLWVAEADSVAVAMLFGRLDPATRVLSAADLWVAPEARGHRIASELLETALGWARAEGARVAELWVNQGNSMARKLYRRAGFRPTTETERLRPGSPHIAIKMTTAL